MIIFQRQPRAGTVLWQLIGLFGLGTIGRAIAGAIQPAGRNTQLMLPFNWTDARLRAADIDVIASAFQRKAAAASGSGRVDLIWSAGRAGMMSDADETACELAAFKDFLDIGTRLRDLNSGVALTYHVVSSAGALFEGQRWVGRMSAPQPQLPYGMLKAQQERLLADVAPEAGAIVYRPSSVYGYSGPGTRLGLIPVLIRNTFHYRTSFIFARADSIRDYVLADDVGKFIAARLDCPLATRQTNTLASARPATIYEIASRIGRIMRRKPLLRFATQHANASDNSYLPDILPDDWRPTTLDTGLRLTTRQIIGAQVPYSVTRGEGASASVAD